MGEAMAGMMASQQGAEQGAQASMAQQQDLDKATKEQVDQTKESTEQHKQSRTTQKMYEILQEPMNDMLSSMLAFMEPVDAFFAAIGSVLGAPLEKAMGKAVELMTPILTALQKVETAFEKNPEAQKAFWSAMTTLESIVRTVSTDLYNLALLLGYKPAAGEPGSAENPLPAAPSVMELLVSWLQGHANAQGAYYVYKDASGQRYIKTATGYVAIK
jgi:hypothetical protein